ncbi:MAG: ABC-2 family transporter protein [Caldilineaceae bacterium]
MMQTLSYRGLAALTKATWLSFLQERGFFFLLAFGWMMRPLVFLFVWATVAGSTTVGGLTRGEFVAYYLIFVVVNQFTYPISNWTVGDQIREGNMSMLLLRPLAPFYDALATDLAGKAVYLHFVVPVTGVLALLLRPEAEITLTTMLSFLPALLLAWLLRFLWGYWLALLAFWATRADALLDMQNALIFLLAGQVAPIALLPDLLRKAAIVLPFRYMIGFPVEVLTNQLTPADLLLGFTLQCSWLALAIGLSVLLWRTGLRRYSAIGG